ncbi:hypothetical protein [Myxococcus sp. Y35]
MTRRTGADHTLLHPLAMRVEASYLAERGVPGALELARETRSRWS